MSTTTPRGSVGLRAAGRRGRRAALPRCPQRTPRSSPSFPPHSAPVGFLHYLKRSVVFICRASDVASCSTVPSRPVYIRRPIWRYKTRRRRGGGPEARERRADRGGHFTEQREQPPSSKLRQEISSFFYLKYSV